MDQFTPHGTYTVSNTGGYEIEISECGDAARLRDCFSFTDEQKVSDWMPIENIIDPDWDGEDENEEFIAVIDPEGYNIPLNQVMRVQR